MIKQRLEILREKMKARKIDAYIIPSADPHQSEYLADYYKTRQYISGFTGSSGTCVVTKDKAGLWTDGRYFIQAEQELRGSGVALFKMGMPQTPSIVEFLIDEVPEHGKVALDGESYPYCSYLELIEKLDTRMIITDVDFIGEMWEDRPEKPFSNVFIYKTEYTGLTSKEKLEKLREKMKEENIDYHFLGALEDICYLYNIRGADIQCNPVVLCYAMVTENEAVLYIDGNKLGKDVVMNLERNGILVKPYEKIYEDIALIPPKSVFYFDPQYTNVNIYKAVKDNVRLKKGMNLTAMMKAVKNQIELMNQRHAYIKDGVALVKFFHWLETGVSTGSVTEMFASRKLREFREEQADFIDDSFPAISAYGKNAALPHYSPSDAHPVRIEPRGLYLIDSGGHYIDGTTDITRTLAMGPLTEEEKKHYTLVLKSHIALLNCHFPRGTKASSLDPIARKPLWDQYLDFNHGTGHGVGYLLSVHEGPQYIAKRPGNIDMVEGMVTSDEPGIYVEGSHGIRIENIMVCVSDRENEFGDFLSFESLSFVPIDTRPVLKDWLTSQEKDWLNQYNQECLKKLSPYLQGDDLAYLVQSTQEI